MRSSLILAAHCPGGAKVKVTLGSSELKLRTGAAEATLASDHLSLVQNLRFQPANLKKGSNTLVVHALDPGFVGLDYVWIKPGKR